MARIQLNKQLEAISIGPKKTEKKAIAGFLLGARYGIGKSKKNKGSNVFSFQDAKGLRFDVWGNASINNSLLANGKLDPQVAGKFIEVEFVRMGKAKKGQSAPKICNVYADTAKKMPK